MDLISPYIFREYDIRGIAGQDLTIEGVHQIGRAYAQIIKNASGKKISVGHDCRLSSPQLAEALTSGVLDEGIDVISLGKTSTPMLYFSLFHLDVHGGVQITGSHNPPEHNGLKLCIGTRSLYGADIQSLYQRIQHGLGKTAIRSGHLTHVDIMESYVDTLLAKLSFGKRRLRVVVDAGNGMGGPTILKVLKHLPVDPVYLFCDPNGHFPNHHPDPTVLDNMIDLQREVEKQHADLGLAFDGDADRLGAVDEKGNVWFGDQLLTLFARSVLQKHPNTTIIGEVKCSQLLFDDIKKNGGTPLMWKAGHSLIKEKMRETGALLAGEMSGHLFF